MVKKIEVFEGVHVTKVTGAINSTGGTDCLLEVVMCKGCNLPKSLLSCAITITLPKVEPINVYDSFGVLELAPHLSTYEATFRYDREFIYLLNEAHASELYKQHNAEADEFIESWLSNE